jgi:hypothetical protein
MRCPSAAARSSPVGEAGLAGWRVFIDNDGDNIWDANETYIRTNSTGR